MFVVFSSSFFRLRLSTLCRCSVTICLFLRLNSIRERRENDTNYNNQKSHQSPNSFVLFYFSFTMSQRRRNKTKRKLLKLNAIQKNREPSSKRPISCHSRRKCTSNEEKTRSSEREKIGWLIGKQNERNFTFLRSSNWVNFTLTTKVFWRKNA